MGCKNYLDLQFRVQSLEFSRIGSRLTFLFQKGPIITHVNILSLSDECQQYKENRLD